MASRLVLRQSPLSCNLVLCHVRKVALARSRSCSSHASPPRCNPPADPAANYDSPSAAQGNDPPADSATDNPPAASGGAPPSVKPPATTCPSDCPDTGEAPPVGPNYRGKGFYVPTHQGRDP